MKKEENLFRNRPLKVRCLRMAELQKREGEKLPGMGNKSGA